MGGEEGDLVLRELLGEGEPPEEGAGFDGGAGEGDGEDVHICRHVARTGQQAWGLLGVQGDGQEGQASAAVNCSRWRSGDRAENG